MGGKHGLAAAHSLVLGDVKMRKKKKAYSLHFVTVGNRSDEIIRTLVKNEIKKVLDKYGAVSDNLDELLHKYITSESGEMCNDTERQGICQGIHDEGISKR